ncbi:MAG: AbrB/MazE/SpoVT family DNA-binding domain-containing protein [Planctomycetota bacterium]|nr:AbrB/MazE/SpoVT family DNA-binding domain-containing protein [Planctomycetota bacterium]
MHIVVAIDFQVTFMEVQFSKWGNSIALRIPSKVAEALGIGPGNMADLDLRRNRMVITPRTGKLKLDELLSQITPENLHSECTEGKAVGAEVVIE